MVLENWHLRIGEKILSCKAPCTLFSALRENGFLDDPYYGANEKALEEYFDADCEFFTAFEMSKDQLSKKRIVLECDCLDTFCEVRLNGRLLGCADNFHRKWSFDIKENVRAGEMCQILNDHWGYARGDCNYKSVRELIENLVDCRRYSCNFLLNTDLKGNGSINLIDEGVLTEIGKWLKQNKGFIYETRACGIQAKGAYLLKGKGCYYAVIKDVGISADPNVGLKNNLFGVKIGA